MQRRGPPRAEGGVLWAELNDAAAEHGLAVTGGAISTHRHRRANARRRPRLADGQARPRRRQPVAVELVTADGEVLNVDAESHPDLFWALRGGGGNFGVATSFTYRLHPLELIVGGLIAHPIDAAPRAAALLPRRGRGAPTT